MKLNFFPSDPPSIETQSLNQQIIATRIYILLIILSMIIVLLYSGPFSNETILKKKEKPSIDDINDLYNKNLSSLSCSCAKVAVRHAKFLSMKFEFHSVCTSEFISPSYRLDLLKRNVSSPYLSFALITHYRILSALCYFSEQFIQNAKKVFDNQELVTIEPLTNSSFNIQMKSIISNFIRQTKSDYRRTLAFITKSFSVNQLIHLLTINWRMDFTNINEKYILKTSPITFPSSNCTCAISSNCNKRLIDEIYIGCFPYDGFRFSKFQNISLGKLNNDLFVENWINQTNYTNYFRACKPSECQYTLSDKNNPSIMFTTLLGLYGG